jgi:ELWxxDGT repeat protein
MTSAAFANAAEMLSFGGALYFFAPDAQYPYSLWRYNGSAVTDLGSDGFEFPKASWILNGDLYFIGLDVLTNDYSLWKYDGSGFTDIGAQAGFTYFVDQSSPFGSFPSPLLELGTDLYFAASDPVHGISLWKYDGSSATIVTGSEGTSPLNQTVDGGVIYFILS